MRKVQFSPKLLDLQGYAVGHNSLLTPVMLSKQLMIVTLNNVNLPTKIWELKTSCGANIYLLNIITRHFGRLVVRSIIKHA